MKSKQLLRFYFGAETLNRAIDNLILAEACLSGRSPGNGESYAGKLGILIGHKAQLGALWEYLDRVLRGMSGKERAVLENYAATRHGLSSIDGGERRIVHAAVMKFCRHARGLDRWSEAVGLVGKYDALTYKEKR